LEVIRWITIVALVVIASGWRPRYTAIAHWWISVSLQGSAITLDGGDQITAVLTLLVLPIALTDDRRWHWQSVGAAASSKTIELLRRLVALTALMAIRLQVSIVYFHAAVGKLNTGEWLNGTVLYYWLMDPSVGLPDWLRAISPLLTSPFVAVITWSILLLETFLFMALVMPKSAWRYWLIAGLLFHLGIALTIGLISFGIAMSAALVLYLRPYEQEFDFSFVRKLMGSKQSIKADRLVGSDVAADL
jgi:antimicrobial peptide system SdpB family protein